MSKSPMVSEKGLIKSRAQDYLGLSQGGDFFGEISLIFNRPRMASVWTTKTTELLELKKGISIMPWEHIPPLRELWRPFRGRDWKSQGTSSPPPGPRRLRQQWFNVRTPSGKRRNCWRRFIL